MNRRKFLQTTAAFGLVAIMPAKAIAGIGEQMPTTILKGPVFNLHIKYTRVNISDKSVIAKTINDMIPGPTLYWKKGEIVTIKVTNHLDEPTSLHWHGIILPYTMDGVPGVSFRGIMPGETFVYRFKIKQTGTYWYHSHTGFQEQNALHGSIVIDDGIKVDRSVKILVRHTNYSDSKIPYMYHCHILEDVGMMGQFTVI